MRCGRRNLSTCIRSSRWHECSRKRTHSYTRVSAVSLQPRVGTANESSGASRKAQLWSGNHVTWPESPKMRRYGKHDCYASHGYTIVIWRVSQRQQHHGRIRIWAHCIMEFLFIAFQLLRMNINHDNCFHCSPFQVPHSIATSLLPSLPTFGFILTLSVYNSIPTCSQE